MNEQMPALLRRAKKGDREAAERLVEENSGLIWSVTRRFFGRGAEPEDLYQLGCVGFLKAVEGFDESFGTRFSTYAVPKISGEIRRFLRDDGAIKVSRSIKEQAAKIRQTRLMLEQRMGREPKLSELAEATGLSAEEIAFAETATGPADSIGMICMKLRILEGGVFEVTVRDWGCGIEDVQKAMTPLFSTGGEERSGMGFTIMDSFTDRLRVRSAPGKGTTVVMQKCFSPRAVRV